MKKIKTHEGLGEEEELRDDDGEGPNWNGIFQPTHMVTAAGRQSRWRQCHAAQEAAVKLRAPRQEAVKSSLPLPGLAHSQFAHVPPRGQLARPEKVTPRSITKHLSPSSDLLLTCGSGLSRPRCSVALQRADKAPRLRRGPPALGLAGACSSRTSTAFLPS
jgi:hypothetical protein